MKSFTEFIIEAGGQSSGQLEVHSISLDAARAFADEQFRKYQGKSLDELLPKFNENFALAQRLANEGFTQRRDMPVIDEQDVKDLQRRLQSGMLDVHAPFANTTKNNPFPQGLQGTEAQQWLTDGLPPHDKAPVGDDVVHCSEQHAASGSLHPIQKQIYFDKSITTLAQNGIAATKNFMLSVHLVVSSDKRIIDGHHRWLSAVLIDVNCPVLTMTVNLPISKLLPLTIAYSDAVGNRRNN